MSWGVIFTQWTPDKRRRHIAKNATHLDLVLVPAVKGFTGSLDQDLAPTCHQVLWLGRGVEATVGLANKDMVDTIIIPMEPGAAHTCQFHPVFPSPAATTSPTSPSEKAESFFRGDRTISRSARRGPPTQAPLSALPSAVTSHQTAQQRHGTL